MRAIITPKFLGGNVKAIASKSFAHRALICAALSNGVAMRFLMILLQRLIV